MSQKTRWIKVLSSFSFVCSLLHSLSCSLDFPSWFFPIAFAFSFVYLQPISSSPSLCLPFNICHLAVKGFDLCLLFLIRSHVNYFQFNLIFLFFGRIREREREKGEGKNLLFSIFLTQRSLAHFDNTFFFLNFLPFSFSLTFLHPLPFCRWIKF